MKQKIISYLAMLSYPEEVIEKIMSSTFSTFLLSEIWDLLKRKDLSDVEIKFIFASEANCKLALSRYNRNLCIDDLLYR